jgi:hypothetical protein
MRFRSSKAEIARLMDVSRTQMWRAGIVRRFAPELTAAVGAGTMTIGAAFAIAHKRRQVLLIARAFETDDR